MARIAGMGIIARLRQHIFQQAGDSTDSLAVEAVNVENLLGEPDQPLEDEITQSHTQIDLAEQLRMIQIVQAHLKEYVLPGVQLEPCWISGHALLNEIFVSIGDEEVCRSNVEAFYQDKATGERRLTYIVSLVRFAEEPWRVLQVKESRLHLI